MIKWAVLLIACLAFAGCDLESLANDRYREDFQYTYDLKPGGRLTVENLNGSVEVTGWEKDTVQITGTKFSEDQDGLKQVRIETGVKDGAVSVRTVAPQGVMKHFGAKYVIRVPRRTDVDRVDTSNGSVRVEDVEGSARLTTTNGSIRVGRTAGAVDVRTTNGSIDCWNLNGTVSARTSNGRITASLLKTDPGRDLRFETSNGSIEVSTQALDGAGIRASTTNGRITLRLPASANARLRARTSIGSIESDFDIKTDRPREKHELNGQIGSGGPLIDLSTTNGGIHIEKL